MTAKKLFSILIISASFQAVFAQKTEIPKLPLNGKAISDFVPKDWKIAQQIEGDLNGDNLADIVLVLQGTNQVLIKEGYLFESNQRIVDKKTDETQYIINNNPLILAVIAKISDQFHLVGQNNNLIPVFTNDNSNYYWNYSATIEDHTLKVELYGRISSSVMDAFGNTSKSFSLQFKDNHLVLVKAEKEESSQSMLPAFGNGYRSDFESYDFLKEDGFFFLQNQFC